MVAGEQDWVDSGMHGPVSARFGVTVKESLNRTGHGTKEYSRKLLQVSLRKEFSPAAETCSVTSELGNGFI